MRALPSAFLNSTYWNLVFQDIGVVLEIPTFALFELHLLESGISGRHSTH